MIKLIREQSSLIIFPMLVLAALFFSSSAALYIIPVIAVIGYFQKGFILPFIILMVLLPFADSTFSFVRVAYNTRPVILIIMSVFVFSNAGILKKTDWSLNGFIIYFIVLSYYLLTESTLINIYKAFSYFLVILTVPVVIRHLIQTNRNNFLRIFIFIYTLIFVISFANFGANIMLKSIGRFSGIFANPNALGIFSFLFFMLTQIIFKYHPQLFSKTERYIVTILILAGLLFSRSRSGMFSVAIFWLATFAYEKWSLKGLIIVVLTGFLINAIIPYKQFIAGVGLSDFLRMETIETGGGRKVAIAEAWQQIKERPIEGHGIGFSEAYFKENQRELNLKGHVGGVHNSFEWVWLDLGLLGLLPFLYGWFRWFRKAFQYSVITLPIGIAVAFSTNIEAWLMGSLNHALIQLIIILSLLSSPSFFSTENHPDN